MLYLIIHERSNQLALNIAKRHLYNPTPNKSLSTTVRVIGLEICLKFNNFQFAWKTLQTNFWNCEFSRFISSYKPSHGRRWEKRFATFADPPGV